MNKMNKNAAVLQKLLNKIAVKRFLDNFNKKLNDLQMSHSELSRKAGKTENAFNKTLNEMEDPRLSSFLRYWFSAVEMMNNRGRDAGQLKFDMLIDEEIEKILINASEITDSELQNFIYTHEDFLIGLDVYVQLLNRKKALSSEEIDLYTNIKNAINEKRG